MNNFDDNQKSIWEMSKKVKLPKPIDSDVSWARLEEKLVDDKQPAIILPRPKLIQLKPALGISAIILLLVLAPLIYIQLNWVNISTERGEIFAHTLPDGSTITLSTESSLKYKKSGWKKARQLEFTGEAYFDVFKGEIPFVVKSEDISVTVLGTQFNIKNRNNLIEVSVNEGKVRVSDTKNNTTSLTAGEMLRFARGEKPQQPQALPFDNYPGWLDNKLIFYQDNLANVCREIERRFNVQVQLSTADVGNITVSGVLEADDIKSVLSTLSILTQRQYRYQKNIYVIY